MSGVAGRESALERARDALEDGAAWRARDILERHVAQERDTEALTLLGEVLHGMGDLPRAGAVWFGAGARGPQVEEAVAAWREHTDDDFPAMWHSLPASVRAEPRPPRVAALHDKALAAVGGDADLLDHVGGPGRSAGGAASSSAGVEDVDGGGGVDAAGVIAWLLAALFVVCAVIGAVTVLGWLVPG